MPSLKDLRQSNYLTKSDVEPPVLVTIKSYEELNVAKEGETKEMRWVLHFKEADKPLILNSTNGQIISQIAKSEEFDNWIGTKVVLYNDPAISYGGRLVGGIRVRAPKSQAPLKEPAAPSAPVADDDVPF